MNKPTTSARSISLPRRSLCQWVDTVTAEMLVKVSMKISSRKWKCLRWLESCPPLSWSYVRIRGRVVVAGTDLGRAGLVEIPTVQAGNVTEPDGLFFWLERQRGKQSAEGKGGGL